MTDLLQTRKELQELARQDGNKVPTLLVILNKLAHLDLSGLWSPQSAMGFGDIGHIFLH